VKKTATILQGVTQAGREGEVVPYVPGSSDPAAEDPWDQPDAHRVEYHLPSQGGGKDRPCRENGRESWQR